MPKTPQIEQLLEHRDFLRGLACSLVTDPGTQEDLVSDAMEEALLRPPRHGALRPWLARVLRNRAKNRRREASRRKQREREIAKHEGVPSAAEITERFELAELLATKVQQLPKAYREVVLFRYYDNLPRRVIAESLGISEEAVKKRLHRALEQLRQNLDRDHGSREKWLGAFAPLTLPGLKTASVGITLGGTLLMSTKTLAPLVLVPLLGLLAWYTFAGPGQAVVPDQGQDRPLAKVVLEDEQPAQVTRKETSARLGGGEPVSTEQAPDRTLVVDARQARISGRCVDDAGKPIQSCQIGLRVSNFIGPEPPRASAKKAPERRIQVSDVYTDKAGNFEMRFLPLPNRGFSLELKAQGYASHAGRLGSLEEGEEVALGDIIMKPGLRVRGRITDEAGTPVVGCFIDVAVDPSRLTVLGRDSSLCRPLTRSYGRTDAMGRFEIRDRLLSGAWSLRLSRQLISPKTLLLPKNRESFDFEIRVKSLAATESIQGTVVDLDGHPLRGARIDYVPRPRVGGMRRGIQSKKNGAFVILRSKEDTGVPVRLRIVKEGYDTIESSKELAWNSEGHRLVMTRGKALTLRVIDSETKKPVQEFGIRMDSIRPGGLVFSNGKADYWDNHQDGVLRTAPIGKGLYKLKVVPITTHLESAWQEIELPRSSSQPLVIELHRPIQQQLRVISNKGQPIVGTQVELLEAQQGLPIDAKTYVVQNGIGINMPNRGYLWTKGITDGSGTLMLSGPPLRELGLRIKGGDHVPLYVNGIRLSRGGDVLTVKVQVGATLVGNVHPMNVLRALDALGSKIPEEMRRVTHPHLKAGLILRAAPPPGKFSFKTFPTGWNARCPIAEDGSFRISGIEPGSWVLQLIWTQPSGSSYRFDHVDLQKFNDLRDGEARKIDLDISDLLLGVVLGSVRWNGAPLENAELILEARKESLSRGLTTPLSAEIFLREDGGFRREVIPAVYDCYIRVHSAGGWKSTDYPFPEPLTVAPGGTKKIQLHLQTTEVHFVFRNHDGNPLPGLRASLLPKNNKIRFHLPASNAKGECMRAVPTGSFQVMIPPKSLSTPEGLKSFMARQSGNAAAAFAAALISVKTVPIAPSTKSQRIEITVPKSAGY